MDVAAVIRKYGSTVLGGSGIALWLAALYLLSSAAKNSAMFDRWLPWILLVNILGLVTLLVMLATGVEPMAGMSESDMIQRKLDVGSFEGGDPCGAGAGYKNGV